MKWKKNIIIYLSLLMLVSLSVTGSENDCLVINEEQYCKTNETKEEPKKIFENSGISWGFDVDHRLGTPQLQEIEDYIDIWVRIKQLDMERKRYLAEAWMLKDE